MGNEETITSLISELDSTQDKETLCIVTDRLTMIAVENEKAIASLISLLDSTQDEFIRWRVAESLEKIITTKQNYVSTVSGLSKHINLITYRINFDLYDKCYNLLWKCAENLTYLEFYQAWYRS